MTILEKIIEKKRERVASAKRSQPISDLKSIISGSRQPRDFRLAVKKDAKGLKIIAEIKKASPSRGLIRSDFDPVRIASLYQENGVDAISVITEEDYFQGRLGFLSDVRKASTLPLLRKDFIMDEYQIYEARAHGADAVLLISAMLSYGQAEEYLDLVRELGISALFEVHDFRELEPVLKLNAPIVGINNRNLRTMAIDLNTTSLLKGEIPSDRIVVSESGIHSRGDLLRVQECGVDAVLVGTSLMSADDISKKIDELRGKA